MTGTERDGLPLVWRIPPWQPAALIFLAAVLLAIDIYGRPSLGPLVLTAAIAAAALVAAAFAIRLLLIADEDGIWVRRLGREQLVEWRHISRVSVETGKRNATTVRITRHDKTYVDVPPSLLLPTKPTSMTKTRKIIDGIAVQLGALAREHR